jgi:hypothetical protein
MTDHGPIDPDKPTPTTGIMPDPEVRQLDQGCPVHPVVTPNDDHIETIEYDKDDDTYLQRCTLTGRTWWARDAEG